MNNPLAGTDPTGYTIEKPKLEKVEVTEKKEKIAPTGSRIKREVTSSVSAKGTYSNGATQTATVNFSGGIPASMTIGSVKEVSKNVVSQIGNAARSVAGSLSKGGIAGIALTPMSTATDDEMETLVAPTIAANIANNSASILQDALQGKSSDDGVSLFRIAGGAANNLKLKEMEKGLSPPGISMLVSSDAQAAAAQFRSKFPNFSFTITGQVSLRGIREAGFDVMADPTSNFINHARLIHPAGAEGFNLENRQRLATYFTNHMTP
ncbi:hypothetical protein J2W69_004082 [Rheinheimera soli]|uniref:Uncharacterized protein n=2 Tax=Rheinheimera soli TaxID=443616 RepID=A0ABU1W573_9GAMM|nr:hypothetical protein [Rheinheimera soli]